MEVVATGRLTTYPGRSNYQIVIDTLAPAGVGALMALLEQRKQKLAAEGLFDEARKQLLPYLPGSDRRRDLADRRGDPRHSASAGRPLSAPRAGVAGARAGRRRGGGNRGSDPRLQCAARTRRAAAPGSADRGARRRLDRRSVGVQRRNRRARRRRQHDPADLRRRPRDRRDADRFCLRSARADADRRSRNGGAGALRTAWRNRQLRPARGGVLAPRPGGAPHRTARRHARAAVGRRCCCSSRASGSTAAPTACRARCAPMRRCIARSFSQDRRAADDRACCAPRSNGGASDFRRIDVRLCHTRSSAQCRRAVAVAICSARERDAALFAARPRVLTALRRSSAAARTLRARIGLARRAVLSGRAGARFCAGARRCRRAVAQCRRGRCRDLRSILSLPTAVLPRSTGSDGDARPVGAPAPAKRGAGVSKGQGSLF